MRASIRIGKILGIPIEVNASWVLIFLLLTYVLAHEFESARLDWPVAQRWSVAAGMVVLLFLSVLIHELSHSVVAKRRGIPVQSITLFIFGNKYLNLAVMVSILLQVAIIYVPWFQDIFETTSLSLENWLLIAVSSITPVLLINIINEIIYKRRRSGVSY